MWSSRPAAQRVINLFLTCLFVLLGGIKGEPFIPRIPFSFDRFYTNKLNDSVGLIAAETTPRPYSCGNQITTDRVSSRVINRPDRSAFRGTKLVILKIKGK